MGLALQYIEGQTPLDDDEMEGLLIHPITTRGELDEFEQHNIEEAIAWSLHRSFKLVSVHCFPNGNGRHSRLLADIICNRHYLILQNKAVSCYLILHHQSMVPE